VPSTIIPNSKLTIVGESPGKAEEREGKPFVGSTGEKLHTILRRKNVSFINAISCRPPPYLGPNKWKQAIKCCQQRLFSDLEKVKDSTLLVCGKWSIYATCGITTQLEKVVGALTTPLPQVKNKYVIPTYHPTYVFFERNNSKDKRQSGGAPHLLPVFKLHLKHASDVAYNDKIFHFPVLKEQKDPITFMTNLLSTSKPLWLGLDVETVGSPYDEDFILRCIGISTRKQGTSILWPAIRNNSAVRDLTQRVLHSHHTLCVHNGIHDIPVLRRVGFEIDINNVFDTIVAHSVLAPLIPHSLSFAFGMEFLAKNWKREFRFGASAGDAKGSDVYKSASDSDLLQYNFEDCIATAKLAKKLHRRLEKHYATAYDAYRQKMRLTYNVGIGMTDRGILVCQRKVAEYGTLCIQKIDELQKELQIIASKYVEDSDKLNYNSNNVIYDMFFNQFGEKPIKYSKNTGKPSFDKEVLTKYLQSSNLDVRHFCRHLLEKRSWDKKYNTYVKKATKVIRPSWQPFRAITGRWSCARPNMQNQHRDLRSLYKARDGYKWVSIDYKQLELKVVRVLAHDEDGMEAFRQGADGHTLTAENMFGVGNVTKDRRKMAKTLNFGILYGGTCETIWGNLLPNFPEITLAQVQMLIDKFKKACPKIIEFQNKTYESVIKDRFLELPLSKRSIFFYSKPKPTEVSNYPIQGTAGDIVDLAIEKVNQEFTKIPDTQLLAQVHDEINFETKHVHESVRVAKDIMETPINIGGVEFSFTVDVEVGDNWGEMKSYEVE
jgi:uracil-DNA glycosylase family 4